MAKETIIKLATPVKFGSETIEVGRIEARVRVVDVQVKGRLIVDQNEEKVRAFLLGVS